MARLPDTSEWYTPERAQAEDISWLLEQPQKKHLAFSLPLIQAHGVKSVVEFGCGSGLFARGLPPHLDYTGIDRNQWFLDRALRRNPGSDLGRLMGRRLFQHWEARNYSCSCDLACAWQFLKNFSLEEWGDLLLRMLHCGRYAAFDLQMADEPADDGEHFPQTAVTEAALQFVLDKGGHRIVARENLSAGRVAGRPMQTVMFWTEKAGGTPPAAEPPVEVTEANVGVRLAVDNLAVADLTRYAVRWYGKNEPVLYLDGKRVCRPWSLTCDLSIPEDKEGRNANTAEE